MQGLPDSVQQGAQHGLVLALHTQQPSNDAGKAMPAFDFELKSLPTSFRNRIEPGLAIVFRGAPIGAQPALLSEAKQRGVDSSFVELQYIVADLFNAARDGVAMQGAQSIDGLEDHQVERTLEDLNAIFL